MSNLYLCLITHNQYENIKQLTDPIWQEVDGIISVDGGSSDGTRELLEERKKGGEVLYRKWTNDHDLQQNVWLRESVLKDGDIFIIRDSMERFNKDWVKGLRAFLDAHQLNGINTFFNYGKLFAARFNDSMIFQQSPHWGLLGWSYNAIDLKTMFDENKKEHTWRIRDGEPGGRPFDNKINHEAKYVWSYGRSNHLLLGMEDEIDMFQRAEMIRLQIREFARQNNFSFDIEGLKKFMEWFKEIDFANFKIWINSHRVWKNFYRYRILGEDFYEIDKSEKDWILD